VRPFSFAAGNVKTNAAMKLSIIAIALLMTACNPSSPATPPPAAPPAATPAAPSSAPSTAPPAVEPQRNITIDAVDITNPLVLSGTARTFENNVALRARAADGTVIAEGFTTATGEMGQHSPYRGSLWLTREPGNEIVVEALEYSAKDGSETNLARVRKAFSVAPVDAALYFPDDGCTGVKPYARRIPKSISMARLLVEALIHGPTAAERKQGAAAAFPEGSAVRSVNLRDGVLTVDFNEHLQNVGGSCRAQMVREAVTRTLSKLPAVKKVVITAGGSEPLALQP
jgi:hypothetical protein